MGEPRRTCPGCESALTPHAAREVHFDRCQMCGGIWIDPHGLAALASERPGDPGSETPRCCPDCGYLLRYATAGDLLVERCAECHGIWIPADALAHLAGDLRPQRTDLPAPPTGDGSFRCPACGERFPNDLGVITPRGLACAACWGAVSSMSSPPASARYMRSGDVPYGLPAAEDVATSLARGVPGPAGTAVGAVLAVLDLLGEKLD